MTLNKRELAHEVKRLIREWGQNAVDFKEGKVTEAWFHRARKNAQEKLVLLSGALAAIVLNEERTLQGPSAAVKQTSHTPP